MGLAAAMTMGILDISTAAASVGNAHQTASSEGKKTLEDIAYADNIRAIPNRQSLASSLADNRAQDDYSKSITAAALKDRAGSNTNAGGRLGNAAYRAA
ncbi:MAG: hypothetical protein LBD73_08060 [Deferribacteraceae bacterium]|jgi:hypothetical protein|nr:hypothetical protein [Deferribacteraceae bacterium]